MHTHAQLPVGCASDSARHPRVGNANKLFCANYIPNSIRTNRYRCRCYLRQTGPPTSLSDGCIYGFCGTTFLRRRRHGNHHQSPATDTHTRICNYIQTAYLMASPLPKSNSARMPRQTNRVCQLKRNFAKPTTIWFRDESKAGGVNEFA